MLRMGSKIRWEVTGLTEPAKIIGKETSKEITRKEMSLTISQEGIARGIALKPEEGRDAMCKPDSLAGSYANGSKCPA
jgi:hypothetical protein